MTPNKRNRIILLVVIGIMLLGGIAIWILSKDSRFDTVTISYCNDQSELIFVEERLIPKKESVLDHVKSLIYETYCGPHSPFFRKFMLLEIHLQKVLLHGPYGCIFFEQPLHRSVEYSQEEISSFIQSVASTLYRNKQEITQWDFYLNDQPIHAAPQAP